MADIRRVLIDPATFEEDLARASKAARTIATQKRAEWTRNGLDLEREPSERGWPQTPIEGCIKVYLPGGGHWRMVFVPWRRKRGEKAMLVFIALGRGHDEPNVYEAAARRMQRS